MQLDQRIDILVELGKVLLANNEHLQYAQQQAQRENPWFTPENMQAMLHAIANNYLQAAALQRFVGNYSALQQPLAASDVRTVGIVMAGNIPLVGFHDLLCVFLSGHRSQIKYSSKDKALMTFVVQSLYQLCDECKSSITSVEVLRQFDAVIATGSDNTNRYFEQYFQPYPHLLRGHRTSVAVLDGSESPAQLANLSNDMLSYFGLGCRNITQLFVPKGYDFAPLLQQIDEQKMVIQHHKYKNNYDHYRAIFLLDRTPHWESDCVLLTEAKDRWAAPVAVVYYRYYDSITEIEQLLGEHHQQIQCVVGNLQGSSQYVEFGKSQQPQLHDYADGIDTMQWLLALSEIRATATKG
jgi:hypothetical protein